MDARAALQALAIPDPDKRSAAIHRFEEIQTREPIILPELAHDADGRAGPRSFQVAEESVRHPHCIGDRGERLPALQTQFAELLTEGPLSFDRARWSILEQPLLLQLMQDRGRVQSSYPAQIGGAPQNPQVIGAIKAVPALGTRGLGKSKFFPRAHHGRGHA